MHGTNTSISDTTVYMLNKFVYGRFSLPVSLDFRHKTVVFGHGFLDKNTFSGFTLKFPSHSKIQKKVQVHEHVRYTRHLVDSNWTRYEL